MNPSGVRDKISFFYCYEHTTPTPPFLVHQGKRLVNINEMSSTKDEFKANFDTMKSYITEPTVKIEPKGVDSYTIKNISNFVLFTNHRGAIIVEADDRRYSHLAYLFASSHAVFLCRGLVAVGLRESQVSMCRTRLPRLD